MHVTNFLPVVSLRSTTGYRPISLRDEKSCNSNCSTTRAFYQSRVRLVPMRGDAMLGRSLTRLTRHTRLTRPLPTANCQLKTNFPYAY